MPDRLELRAGRDSGAVQARLRELGAAVSYSLLAGGEIRNSVRLPDDPDAAHECRRIVEEWNRDS